MVISRLAENHTLTPAHMHMHTQKHTHTTDAWNEGKDRKKAKDKTLVSSDSKNIKSLIPPHLPLPHKSPPHDTLPTFSPVLCLQSCLQFGMTQNSMLSLGRRLKVGLNFQCILEADDGFVVFTKHLCGKHHCIIVFLLLLFWLVCFAFVCFCFSFCFFWKSDDTINVTESGLMSLKRLYQAMALICEWLLWLVFYCLSCSKTVFCSVTVYIFTWKCAVEKGR